MTFNILKTQTTALRSQKRLLLIQVKEILTMPPGKLHEGTLLYIGTLTRVSTYAITEEGHAISKEVKEKKENQVSRAPTYLLKGKGNLIEVRIPVSGIQQYLKRMNSVLKSKTK